MWKWGCTYFQNLIGGVKSDELYSLCKSSGAAVIERISKSELRHYYAAADVYVKYPINEISLTGMGIGTASTEALSSETPVVGNHLINFLGDVACAGIKTNNPEDFAKDIEKVLIGKVRFENLREIVRENYDWENLIHKMIQRYDVLSEKYGFSKMG